jgi:hypothetical protein
MIGLKGRFLGFAIADLNERALKVYREEHISFQLDWASGGTITSRGDVLIEDGRGAYLVPNGDFTKPSLPVRPSRHASVPSGIGPYMGFVTDPSGSSVWIKQPVYDKSPGPSREVATWIDLFNVDTGQIILTADFEGRWGTAGALDGGLLMRESGTRVFKVDRYTIDSTVLEEPGRLLILRSDGTRHHVEPDLDATPTVEGPAEGWRQGFRLLQAYGSHIALLRKDNGEMIIVDAETDATSHIPKPGPGFWTPTNLPFIPIESISWTHSDEFSIGFRSGRFGDWSLHKISLSNQSVHEIYRHPQPLTTAGYWRHWALATETVADGAAVLAFTRWPSSPDNAGIQLIGPNGELIPVAAVPDDFFILDTA